jgi:carboxyl-terminal processing protease
MIDSLKYKTLKGRTVYGGGGIMPDVFVPRDTSDFSPYLNKVVNYGYLYQFAFQYADQNRAELKKLKTWQQLETFLSSKNVLAGFVAFASTKGIKPSDKDIEVSKRYLVLQLHAYIIRDILGDKGFYPIINNYDKTVKVALSEIKKIK